MKCKFLALSVLLTTFVFSYVNASNVNSFSQNDLKLLSKGNHSVPFYKASDSSIVQLVGGTNSEYTKLPFSQDKRKHLNGISPSKCNKGFIVEKGSYLINFTGTLQQVGPVFTNTAQIAVKVGSKFFNVNTNKSDENDPTQIVTTYQLFHFDKETKISIVARNTTPNGKTYVGQRTLSIIKLD